MIATNEYILVSELAPGWTNEQRLEIRGGVGALGPQSTSSPIAAGQPSNVNHSRMSVDGTGILFRAMFEPEEITRENIVTTMADTLGLPYAAVNAQVEYEVFDNVQAVKDMLYANAAEWGEVVANN